jgi:porin
MAPVCFAYLFWLNGAFGDSTPPASQPAPATQPDGFFSQLSQSNTLFGDIGGLRPWMSKYGLTLNISETSEILGNVSGGTSQGFDYEGLTQMDLQLDTQKAFNLHGGLFNVSGLQIHGNDLLENNLDVLQAASGIAAEPATRLWELWYQQSFGDHDQLDVKVGEQSLDQEFMVTQDGAIFVNATLNWPNLASENLPAGGPQYPLASPGVRLRAQPTDSMTVLAGVFSGSPAPTNSGDPEEEDSSGTSFSWYGGVLAIAEVQYSTQGNGASDNAGGAKGLPGVYKLGVWYDSNSFPDQEYDNAGMSLASTATSGIPESHWGNYAIYAAMDQMIWRDATDGNKSVSVFVVPTGTTLTDRNLVDFSCVGGVTMHEPIPGRSADTAGIGAGYAHISSRAGDLDRDRGFVTDSPYPVRTGETFIETTYQYQLTPWFQLQPDFQYFFNPSGGVPNPKSPGNKIKDEAVLGMRATIQF